MSDTKVNRWKQSGHIYLWRGSGDVRNLPGWNLTADKTGCLAFQELVSMMITSKWGSKKELTITSRPKSGGDYDGRLIIPKEWTIQCRKVKCEPSLWHWEGNWSKPKLFCGVDKLRTILRSLDLILQGEGDFIVSSNTQKLHGIDRTDVSISFWPVTNSWIPRGRGR